VGPSLELEALVQVACADHGSGEQLLARLGAIRRDGEARRAEAIARMHEYAESGGPFPERLPVIALTGRFLLEYCDPVARWAAWAEAEVGAWDGVTPATGARVPLGAF